MAWWATARDRATRESSAGYFLAGRHAGWWVIGASLFAANIGSEHLVGLAGTGAASGVAGGHFEVAASWILLLLGWVFVPFYLRNGVFTMPEFLERRYSPAARWYLALVSIAAYVITKISVTIAARGIVFEYSVKEKIALETTAVREAFTRHRVVYLKGDWTNADPALTAFLRANGRSGVSLYLYYPPGRGRKCRQRRTRFRSPNAPGAD